MQQTTNQVEESGFNDFEKKVFSVISKEGSFSILQAAESKLESRRGIWHELGLTKRQYYTRIRRLKDAYLIKKVGEKYVLTKFGEKIYDTIGNLKSYTSNPEKLKMLSESVDTNLFSDEGSVFSMKDLDNAECLEIFYSREALVDGLVEHINKAEDVLYLASNYTDRKVVKALLETDDDLTIGALGSQKGSNSALERLKAVSSMGNLKRLINITSNSARYSSEIPYSFALRDGEYLGLEIPDPLNPEEFFIGGTFKDRKLYEHFLSRFAKMYEESGGTSLPISE